jgi:hypothetical protein
MAGMRRSFGGFDDHQESPQTLVKSAELATLLPLQLMLPAVPLLL